MSAIGCFCFHIRHNTADLDEADLELAGIRRPQLTSKPSGKMSRQTSSKMKRQSTKGGSARRLSQKVKNTVSARAKLPQLRCP